MKDEILRIQTELIDQLLACDVADYTGDDFRPLLNAIFELSDFLCRMGSDLSCSDGTVDRVRSNVETVKTICQRIVDVGADLDYSPIRRVVVSPQRFTQALEDTKRHLKSKGLFDVIDKAWADVALNL